MPQRLETNGQTPVERPLAALNTAFADTGVVIRAVGAAAKPVNLIYLHQDTTSDAMIHNVIKVEAGAEMTLLETGPAAARFSKTLEVDVADGGTFHHVRAQGRDHERRAVTHCFARIGKESTFKSFTLTANGVLTRNECIIDIVGDDAVAHVAGACVGDGGDFHHDDTVFITHDAVNCESRQVFKKVLRNGATANSSPSQSLKSTQTMWPVRTALPRVRLMRARCFTCARAVCHINRQRIC